MKNVNPTDSKTVALHFLDRTQSRYTPAIVSKTIMQVKNIMKVGYTKEEMIDVIDYIVDETDVNMYSIGYISSCINDVIRKIDLEKEKQLVKEKIEKSKTEYLSTKDTTEGVIVNDESKERNRNKARNTGIQSGEREKSYLDMLEE